MQAALRMVCCACLFLLSIPTVVQAQSECSSFCSCSTSGGFLLADVTTTSDSWESHNLVGGGVTGTFEFRNDCVESHPARGRVYGCFPEGPDGPLHVCLTWVDADPGQDNSAHWRSVQINGYDLVTAVGGIDQAGCSSIQASSCPEAWGLVGYCDCRGVTELEFVASPAQCYPDLPSPQLVFEGTYEYVGSDGMTYISYDFDVPNWAAYPADLFEPAPDLPPCGLSTGASRTWVGIYDTAGAWIYGFCGFNDPANLPLVWFGRRCEIAPDSVYIRIMDRRCDINYQSNTVAIYHAVLSVEAPVEACPGSPIEVCGNVNNCSAIAVDLTVTIQGQQQMFPNVAPGADVTFCTTMPMPSVELPDTAAVIPVTVTAGPDQIVTTKNAVIRTCPDDFACPHTIGFWRQQCAQKGNGSTKVCLDGMVNLWSCVLAETDVAEWRMNSGSYETTASLLALGGPDRFAHLCSQLQGPRPMMIRDMAEIQYLALMLNVCAGALDPSTRVENAFSGTVGGAVDAIEEALNSGEDIEYWKTVADHINNRIGIEAPGCPEGNDLFQNLSGCVDVAQSDPTVIRELRLKVHPNPVSASGMATVHYVVPAGQERVVLSVFDVAGRLVRRLVGGGVGAGDHFSVWDLTREDGSRVSTGVYFYRLETDDSTFTQKLLVVQP